MTTFDYPIFQAKDPTEIHANSMKRIDKEQKTLTYGIIPGKPPETDEQRYILNKLYEEQDREINKKKEKMKNNSMRSKQDLSAFTKKMNQQRIIGSHVRKNEDLFTAYDEEQMDEDAQKLQE